MKTRIKNRRHEVIGTTEHSFSEAQSPYELSIFELVPRFSLIKSVKITYVIKYESKEAEVEK